MLGLGITISKAIKPLDAFSIDSISGLELWLKFDTGITTVSDKVSQWNDQSGNDRHAKQAVPSRRPAYSSGDIDFDGTDDRFDFDAEFSVNEFTIAVVIDPQQASPTNESILGKGANDFLRVHQGGQSDRVFMKANAVSMDQDVLTENLPTDKFLLVVTRDTGSTANAEVRVNGAVKTDETADDFDSTQALDIKTIATSGGGLNPFDGLINEVVIYDSALSGDDLTNVENDIMTRNSIS